jgi:Phage tail lysozyme
VLLTDTARVGTNGRQRFALATVALLVGSLFAVGLTPATAAPASASDDVAQARATYTKATATVSSIEDRLAADGKALTQALTALDGAKARQSAARAEERQRHTVTVRTAHTAKRATAASDAAAQHATDTRATLLRMVRNAYLSGFADTEFAMLLTLITDGHASLADFSQTNTTANHIEQRMVLDAEAAARAAQEAKLIADQAVAIYNEANAREQEAHKATRAAVREAVLAARSVGGLRKDIAARKTALLHAEHRLKAARGTYQQAIQAACDAGAGSGYAGAPPASAGPQAKAVWTTLLANGFTEEAAAGVLGNLQQESGVDPTSIQSGGPGMGLAQWSRGGRWDSGPHSLTVYATTHGLDPWAAETQIEFMLYEMESGWGGFDLSVFKRINDVAKATIYFHDVYERSADSAAFVRTVRVGFAKGWYTALTGSLPVHANAPTQVIPACT